MLAIVTTPRSGSSLLCDAIAENSNINPREYLNFDNTEFLEMRVLLGPQGYFRWVKSMGGIKLFPESKMLSLSEFRTPWHEFITQHCTRFIYLRRSDSVDQAISHFIAGQARVWQVRSDEDAERQRTATESIEYDFDTIYKAYVTFEAGKRRWDSLFDGPIWGSRVLRLDFDELTRNPTAVITKVMSWAGTEKSGPLVFPEGIRPSAPKPEGLKERFLAELEERHGPEAVLRPGTHIINELYKNE